MNDRQTFLLIAKAGVNVTDKEPTIAMNGKPTVMRICIRCGSHQPHEYTDGTYICVVCGPHAV